jgi:hypothetical protein
MFMLLYSQSDFYEKIFCELAKKHDLGRELSVTEWTCILNFVEIEGEYLEFSNEFLFNTYTLLLGREPLRIPSAYQQKLHLSHDIKVGNWFIFKRFIVIKIYSNEVDP